MKKEIQTNSGNAAGCRIWVFRLAALFVVPALFFLAVELGLRISGYGVPTSFTVRHEVNGEERILDNPHFTRKFFGKQIVRHTLNLSLPLKKGPDTCRIFLLGGSAAMGDPEQSYGMGRILEVMLLDHYPGVDFKVLNVAMTAINSHVVLPIAKACSKLEGDLFVVYLGNNEVVGPYGAGTVFAPLAPSLTAIRAGLAIKSTRMGQLIANVIQGLGGEKKGKPKVFAGMSVFLNNRVRASDPRMETVYHHFERNLRDICGAGVKAGVPVVLSTVGVNRRDCAPFASLHRPGLSESERTEWEVLCNRAAGFEKKGKYQDAEGVYLKAARIDGRFADLQYRLARCYEAMEDFEKARQAYGEACDLDTLRFRADTRINRIIRRIATEEFDGEVYLADFIKVLEDHSPRGIPGDEFFYEHVHLTFSGNYLAAKTLFGAIEPLLPEWVRKKASGRPMLSQEECARRLAFTGWNRHLIAHGLWQRMQGPPFTSQLNHEEKLASLAKEIEALKRYTQGGALEGVLAQYETALREYNYHWTLRDRYAILQVAGFKNAALAEKQYRILAAEHPLSADIHRVLGEVLKLQGKISEAIQSLRNAVEIDVYNERAHWNLAACLMHQGPENTETLKQAVRYSQRALELAPRDPNARRILAAAYRQQAMMAMGEDERHQAKDLLKKALSVDNDFSEAHYDLAALLNKEGDEEGARSHLREVLRIHPEDQETRELLEKLQGEGTE
jgi:tetratricopeptide (TPR) repeat protein